MTTIAIDASTRDLDHAAPAINPRHVYPERIANLMSINDQMLEYWREVADTAETIRNMPKYMAALNELNAASLWMSLIPGAIAFAEADLAAIEQRADNADARDQAETIAGLRAGL